VVNRLQRHTHEWLGPRPTEATCVDWGFLATLRARTIPTIPRFNTPGEDSDTLRQDYSLAHLLVPPRCTTSPLFKTHVGLDPPLQAARHLLPHALYGQSQLCRQSTECTANTGDLEKLWVGTLETCSAVGPTHAPTAEHAREFSHSQPGVRQCSILPRGTSTNKCICQ
jgi:hypothetical protein